MQAALKGCATSTRLRGEPDIRDSRTRTQASGLPERSDRVVGWVFALACLTRYEAWPVTVAALVAAVWACWRRGEALGIALRAASDGSRSTRPSPSSPSRSSAASSSALVRVRRLLRAREQGARRSAGWRRRKSAWGVRMLSGPLLVAIGARRARRSYGDRRVQPHARVRPRRRVGGRDGGDSVGGVRRRATRSGSATWCR